MNKQQVEAVPRDVAVAYTFTKRGLRPPKQPHPDDVRRGLIIEQGCYWLDGGVQRRNGIVIQPTALHMHPTFHAVEPRAVICLWDEWIERQRSKDTRTEQDLRGDRLARTLAGEYMRNASGGVVLLSLDRAEEITKALAR